MTHEPMTTLPPVSSLTRRRFLAAGAASAAALASSGCATIRSGNAGSGAAIYSSDFVPNGALFTIAMVADHHYWPNHMKDWGEKQTSHSEERMRDLVDTLNDEPHDISIHCGDVIDAGNSFEPPPDEYIRQLEFEKAFLGALKRPAIPLIGNHEVPDAHYESEAELTEWKKRFGPPTRYVDIKGWRLVCLNIMVPNPGESKGKGQVYGIDDGQVKWLEGVLAEAKAKSMSALLFFHVPPAGFNYKNDFERVVAQSGCVKGIFCGHDHSNSRTTFGGVPVFVRIGNASSPMGYSLIYVYQDGKILVKQKSQILPYLNYNSQTIRPGLQKDEADRYYTIGGASDLPLRGLRVVGDKATADVRDGHLAFRSPKGKAFLLIDAPDTERARLTITAVKDTAARMGVVACADSGCTRRIEGVVTSVYGPDGNMHMRSYHGSGSRTLDCSWFNIADGIAYRFTLEARGRKLSLAMKNMPRLAAELERVEAGKFGIFVEDGGMLVTDIRLERV